MRKNDNSHSDNSRPKNNRAYRFIALMIIIFFVLLTGASLGFLTASIHTMPNLKGDIRPPASSQIFDINGNLLTTVHSSENRVPVSINKIPKNLRNAFVAAEDARFYQHIGIDPRGILRAVWANITNRTVSEGGSTITQQLAKNALLSQEQTLKRKIQEVFLALQIERQFSKDEILELYLNQIYFGQGAYGVQAASQTYFGKNVEDLDLAECALLAGIPKSPNYYSPFNNAKAAAEREKTVLDQMVKYDYLDRSTANAADNEKIKYAARPVQTDAAVPASYFVDFIIQQVVDKYGADAVYKDGLKIYTTLDPAMQQDAEDAMTNLPNGRTDSNGVKQPQGALVAIDPHTGYIKAMVGGRGTDQFNRAVMAERQPGSAFKPFVYLAAIENGMSVNTVIDDSPVTFDGWSPVNYDGDFHGKVTLKSALIHSLNVPTVKLANQIGVDKPLYYAQQMGISTLVLNGPTNDRNLAMSLGGLTRGVTPLELASAYGVLANQGIRVEPVGIIKIMDRNGNIIQQHIPRERAVINERSVYTLTSIMRGVINSGTGAAANIGRPAAGKTGTTNDYKDAWFVGFTPDLVAAVWMGYDAEGNLNGITGGSLPAQIWRIFMNKALRHYPTRDFIRPSGAEPYTDSNDSLETEDKNKPKPNTDDKKKPDEAVPPGDEQRNDNKPAGPNAKPEKPTPPHSPAPPNLGKPSERK